MKILVCLKQVPHKDARLDVRSDAKWIQEENIKFEINVYDTYALEEALRIKDRGEAEVVVACIGPDRVQQSLRTALGMGADRAIHIWDEALASTEARTSTSSSWGSWPTTRTSASRDRSSLSSSACRT
jgi:electron transfer flavoprotein beta subunit